MPARTRPTRVLIADLIGLRFDAEGQPDPAEARAHITAQPGCRFLDGPCDSAAERAPDPQRVDFHYCPDLSTAEEFHQAAADGRYDALIAAASFVPESCRFDLGGVRIGAGTGNMGSASWGGPSGIGGPAPLMNTPGINSRATAQMVWKALMSALPDLPFGTLHDLVAAGRFDTGRDLRDFPTVKLEGQRLAVIGFGNIGREVARLGQAFGMDVAVHARPHHRRRIEAEGFIYAPEIAAAADGASALTIHIGLGPMDPARGVTRNTGILGAEAMEALAPGAVLINFDRGEVVDTAALGAALESGRVGRAIIDADVFLAEDGTGLRGPMAPYLPLLERWPDALTLLPHAAADTDHPSRVAGATQAVDQILSVIRKREVINLVGALPAGLRDAGSRTPPGIGDPHPEALAALAAQGGLEALRGDLQSLIAAIEGVDPARDETAGALTLQALRVTHQLREIFVTGASRAGGQEES